MLSSNKTHATMEICKYWDYLFPPISSLVNQYWDNSSNITIQCYYRYYVILIICPMFP